MTAKIVEYFFPQVRQSALYKKVVKAKPSPASTAA
jgi:hypothetical protein